jgi:myosin-1
MQIVGFMDHEAESVLEVVSTVLKLGNIEFKPESRVNGLDESKIKDKNGKSVENQLCLGNLL